MGWWLLAGGLWIKIRFVSQIFFDGIDFKAFLTPEKRDRNEFSAPQSSRRTLNRNFGEAWVVEGLGAVLQRFRA